MYTTDSLEEQVLKGNHGRIYRERIVSVANFVVAEANGTDANWLGRTRLPGLPAGIHTFIINEGIGFPTKKHTGDRPHW